MAKEKIVTERFTSDISGEEATHTIPYAINGTRYEIDVTDVEAKGFHEVLAPYISVSRVKGQRSGGNGAERKARTEETAKIRSWAAENGIAMPATGRIPNDVRDRYTRRTDGVPTKRVAKKTPARKRPAVKKAVKKASPRKRPARRADGASKR